jgi:hypothetical protein
LHAAVPPRVDYQLTELGASALAPVSALSEWARANQGAILANRARHDVLAKRGKPARGSSFPDARHTLPTDEGTMDVRGNRISRWAGEVGRAVDGANTR